MISGMNELWAGAIFRRTFLSLLKLPKEIKKHIKKEPKPLFHLKTKVLKIKNHHIEGLVAITAGRYVLSAECYTRLTLFVYASLERRHF